MKIMIFALLAFSVTAQAQDYFGDQGFGAPSTVRYEMDNANKVLLDNLNIVPTPFYDVETDVCYVNNCPQVHCSPCKGTRECRTINCEGERVELWAESC